MAFNWVRELLGLICKKGLVEGAETYMKLDRAALSAGMDS